MASDDCFVGIDISKKHLDVHIHGREEHWQFHNDAEGIRDLIAMLHGVSPSSVVVEATGGYEMVMVSEVCAAGLPVAVVNPTRVRRFAQALGQVAKTDRIDARMIAHFASVARPPCHTLQSEEEQNLAGLIDRRRQVIVMLSAEKNR